MKSLNSKKSDTLNTSLFLCSNFGMIYGFIQFILGIYKYNINTVLIGFLMSIIFGFVSLMLKNKNESSSLLFVSPIITFLVNWFLSFLFFICSYKILNGDNEGINNGAILDSVIIFIVAQIFTSFTYKIIIPALRRNKYITKLYGKTYKILYSKYEAGEKTYFCRDIESKKPFKIIVKNKNVVFDDHFCIDIAQKSEAFVTSALKSIDNIKENSVLVFSKVFFDINKADEKQIDKKNIHINTYVLYYDPLDSNISLSEKLGEIAKGSCVEDTDKNDDLIISQNNFSLSLIRSSYDLSDKVYRKLFQKLFYSEYYLYNGFECYIEDDTVHFPNPKLHYYKNTDNEVRIPNIQ